MQTLDSAEISRRLASLPGWVAGDRAISRQFTFAEFPSAVSFVVRLGFAAEAADHHPDIHLSYKKATVSYTTHSAGGLTGKDFEGAAQASAIAAGFGAA